MVQVILPGNNTKLNTKGNTSLRSCQAPDSENVSSVRTLCYDKHIFKNIIKYYKVFILRVILVIPPSGFCLKNGVIKTKQKTNFSMKNS